jgi:hypothetical protein
VRITVGSRELPGRIGCVTREIIIIIIIIIIIMYGKSHIGHCTHTAGSANVEIQRSQRRN